MDQNTSSTVEAKDRHVDPAIATSPQKVFKFWNVQLSTRRVAKGGHSPSSLPPLKAKGAGLENTSVDLIATTKDDAIIALIGFTGTGKSSFVNMLTENDAIVGHDLEPCTAEVSMSRIGNIVLVDTPGFDDTDKTDRKILSMIADWLTHTYKREIKLAGILYFHRITDNRVTGTPLKNLHMFEKLCGKHALGNIILTTTMWDKIDETTGQEREMELGGQYWESMIKLGSTTARYHNTKESAWEILDKILRGGRDQPAVLFQTPVALNRPTTDDAIIALIGLTGTGKSSFINMLTENGAIVRHDLESCTAGVGMVRVDNIVLVDTPGFDNTDTTDREILSMIADWLTNTYKRDIKLAGILYFHRITDNRVTGTPLKNLRMFEKLCGKHALGNIILTTTMWDKVDETTGQEREMELKEQYWESMIKLGSTTARYHNTKDSAWEILDTVLRGGYNRHAVPTKDAKGLPKETDAGGPVHTPRRQQDAPDRSVKQRFFRYFTSPYRLRYWL